MRVQFNFEHGAAALNSSVPLNALFKKLLRTYQPAAVKNNSFFINDIPTDLAVRTDENKLANLASSLLYKIIDRSHNCCIRLSAKKYNNVVLLHVKETSSTGSFLSSCDLNEVKGLAEKMGGCITLNTFLNKGTTVTLSFVNQRWAA